MLISMKRCIIFNFFVILWYNNIDTLKRLFLTKRRANMTYKQIFNEWTDNLPHKRKVQVAEELLLIAKSNHISGNTAAAVLRLLLVIPVVGHIPVLTLLELHMVLGLLHILQFGYCQSAHKSLWFSINSRIVKIQANYR